MLFGRAQSVALWYFFKTQLLMKTTTKQKPKKKKDNKETQADANTLTVIKSQINKKPDCPRYSQTLFQPKYKVSKHCVCIFPTAAT